jgi:hypothetical protein
MEDNNIATNYGRRGFLKMLSVGLIGSLSLGIFLGAKNKQRSRENVLDSDLPGEGSIFQPRNDERLASWLRNRKRKTHS